MNQTFEPFMLGVVTASAAIITLFFLNFWRRTRDPLFLAFAASFAVECMLRLVRVGLLMSNQKPETVPLLYSFRLLSSLLILLAIVRKNYRARQ